MPEYSPGPFMHMSPSGFPGLVIVIATIFAVSTLFVSRDVQAVLFWITLLAIAVAGAVSLRGWLRADQDRMPHIDPDFTPEVEAPPTSIDTLRRRNRRIALELLVLVGATVAAIIVNALIRLR